MGDRMTPFAFALALVLAAVTPALAGNWNVPVSAKHLENPVEKNARTLEAGREVYRGHCGRCHGATGAGDGAAEERAGYDLRTILPGLTDGELFWKVTHGVGKMPSFAGVLTETERWLVITHMRTFAGSPRADSR